MRSDLPMYFVTRNWKPLCSWSDGQITTAFPPIWQDFKVCVHGNHIVYWSIVLRSTARHKAVKGQMWLPISAVACATLLDGCFLCLCCITHSLRVTNGWSSWGGENAVFVHGWKATPTTKCAYPHLPPGLVYFSKYDHAEVVTLSCVRGNLSRASDKITVKGLFPPGQKDCNFCPHQCITKVRGVFAMDKSLRLFYTTT